MQNGVAGHVRTTSLFSHVLICIFKRTAKFSVVLSHDFRVIVVLLLTFPLVFSIMPVFKDGLPSISHIIKRFLKDV